MRRRGAFYVEFRHSIRDVSEILVESGERSVLTPSSSAYPFMRGIQREADIFLLNYHKVSTYRKALPQLKLSSSRFRALHSIYNIYHICQNNDILAKIKKSQKLFSSLHFK